MGLVIRIHDIASPNDFTVSIKKGDTAYPLDSGYYLCGSYAGGTDLVNISGYTAGSTYTTLEFDTQYWIKLIDTDTNRYIIENIKTNNEVAFAECNCTPPLITSLECDIDNLDCDLQLEATLV